VDGPNQRWYVDPQQRIHTQMSSDRCLDAADSTLRSVACSNANSQRWQGVGEQGQAYKGAGVSGPAWWSTPAICVVRKGAGKADGDMMECTSRLAL
jgi:hypothetical protein